MTNVYSIFFEAIENICKTFKVFFEAIENFKTLTHLQLENLYVSCMFLIYGDNMILIDYSNNETIEFQTISQAKMFTADLLEVDIKALGIRCEDSSDFNLLEDYILGLTHSIS